MFQSLKGILVNFNRNRHHRRKIATLFQSLKGILVNFNRPSRTQLPTNPVSIPQRDFGEFQRGTGRALKRSRRVSIPQRDFGEFQLFHLRSVSYNILYCFNPSKGFW
ncbi:hypothetical protein CKA32_001416 [Geitlerinema sp. FC II]|nr:hypothetical protein CKA32_001416 [Geitlerinema sp. FC II]